MTRPQAPPPLPDPVIQRPELAGRPRRLGFALLTLFAWLVWVYLWLPLVSLVAWALGIRLFRQEILLAPDSSHSLGNLAWFLGTVLLAALIYTGWAQYNLHRFRGKERRRAVANLSDTEAAAYFHLSPSRLSELRGASRTVIHLDPDGEPIFSQVENSLHLQGHENERASRFKSFETPQ